MSDNETNKRTAKAELDAVLKAISTLEDELDALRYSGKADLKLSLKMKRLCNQRASLRHYISRLNMNSI